MKAVLEFNLPEEESDFNLACKGKDWWYVCWNLDQYLRKQLKYNDNISEDAREVYEDLRHKLWEEISDRNISFDDVE